MTTMKRTWSHIKLVLGAIVITAALGSNALAEDDTHAGYGVAQPQYNAKQQSYSTTNYDQHYRIPQSYNGKYYPDDDAGAIGYHGSSNSTQNQTSGTTPYYYYY